MLRDTAQASGERLSSQQALEEPSPKRLLRILERHAESRDGLIALLEDIQGEYGYLPETALRVVGEKTGRSLVDIYGVATFYRAFTLKPRGKHLVSACLGTACHIRSAPRVLDELQRQLGVKAGDTTPDGEFTLETVNCLGACALGPVVVVDGHYFSKVDTAAVRTILEKARQGLPPLEEPSAATRNE